MMLAYTCQALHCLPYSGGLLEQPAHIVEGIRLVLDATNTRIEKERKLQQTKSKRGKRWGRRRR